MPNIITHVLFSDEVFENIDHTNQAFLESRIQLMEIGANGPDFLFFHGMNPKDFLKKSKLRKVGNEAHSHSINEFYRSAINSVLNETNEEIKLDMMAYLCGHLCHWALDSVCHPYIFYRTGNCQGKSAWWHHRFESLIDAIMLKVKNECTIKDFKAYEVCEVTLEQARAIARVYVPIIRNVYHTEVKPHQILESLNDWCFIEKVLYDASGNKFNTALNMEKITGMESFISGYFVPDKPDDPFDTMNLLHKKWCHPCDDTKVSTESFFDLYERAKLKALDGIRLFLLACEDVSNIEDFINFINNQSYDTGLSELKEMIYFNPVYEK